MVEYLRKGFPTGKKSCQENSPYGDFDENFQTFSGNLRVDTFEITFSPFLRIQRRHC